MAWDLTWGANTSSWQNMWVVAKLSETGKRWEGDGKETENERRHTASDVTSVHETVCFEPIHVLQTLAKLYYNDGGMWYVSKRE